jgi:hypothetical protein
MRNISKNSFIEALEARKDDVYVRILQDVSSLDCIRIFFSFLSFLNVFFSQRKHTSQFNSWLILESGTNDSVIHVVCPGSTAVGSDIAKFILRLSGDNYAKY